MTDRPNWDDLVPEVTLRPQQRDALDQLFDAFFVREKQVVLLEAPTGVGKSIIQLALCRFFNRELGRDAFIVTPQKVLQDQMKGWGGMRIMKGKGSYECTLMKGSSITARNAPCNLNPQVREDNPSTCSVGACPFYSALEAAKASRIVMHNYASLMAQSRMSGHFGPRGLLCMDEAHTAVDWVRSYMSCEVQPGDLLSLTTDEPPKRADMFLPWLKWQLSRLDPSDMPVGLSDEMTINIKKMFAHPSGYGLMTEEELRHQYAESDGSMGYEAFAKRLLIKSGDVPWHTQWNEPNRFKPEGWWTITPVKVAKMSRALTGLGDKILAVSATILHKSLFASELGIPLDEIEMVTIRSAFDAENRPIKKMYAGSMSFKSKGKTFPKMIDTIVRIASMHPRDPGMIHTVSHYLARDVVDALSKNISNRTIEQLPYGAARTDVIQKFLAGALGPNAILVGPSMMEGVDGADGSCRWQVMAKAPWLHMKDPAVEYLMNHLDKKWAEAWYMWKASQTSVQGFGRVVRSASDFGTTYLLDSGFERIIRGGFIPDYVIDAVQGGS